MTFNPTLFATTALCGLLVLSPLSAHAQVPDAARTTADPGRVQQQLLTDTVLPEVSEKIRVKSVSGAKAPPGAENIRFNLVSIQIEDSSDYPVAELEALYKDKIGTTVTLQDMYDLSGAMNAQYNNSGYIFSLVNIPPQTIENGDIKFRVRHGTFGRVTVTGDDSHGALTQVRKYAAQLEAEPVINSKDMERYLRLINDLPGIESRAILTKSDTGTTDINIVVEHDLYEAFVAADNFGSRYLGPLQLSAAGNVNSFFGNNERISAQAVYAPDSGFDTELAFGALSYFQPITKYGTTVELGLAYTATEPGYNLEQFEVEGHSQFFSAKVEHPFVRSRAFSLYGHLQFDWRDVETKNILEPTREDRIRTVRAGGRLEAQDSLIGVAVNAASVEVSQGLSILGASNENSSTLSRPDGQPDFTKIEAEVQRLQRITSGVNLLLAAQGQYTSDPLLSSEEFGVGGTGYGRGFDPSEIVGDQGFAGKAELQWNEPVRWDFVQDYQVFGFFDAGRTFNEDATTSSQKTDTLTSTGFGIRADFLDDTQAGAVLAFPLNRDVETQNDRDPRFYFNISRRF